MNKPVKTRFAPSPTGVLHVGNIRTALINWLYTARNNGEFILRIDDTDSERSKTEYVEAIKEDLNWLGITWDRTEYQSKRGSRYEEAKKFLIDRGRLYECYETPEELETKRKLQLSSGKPPIYDRAALNLSEEQKQKYRDMGRKPHYRFYLEDKDMIWQDMVKGETSINTRNLSDPILIRADGSMTYMLCSVVDDIDFDISHIIRGEDHVSNSAIMQQIFGALEHPKSPALGHVGLIKMPDDKLSKRAGGGDVKSLKAEGIEPEAICSMLAQIGTSNPVKPCSNMQQLIEKFDINSYTRNTAMFMKDELIKINHKIVSHQSYSQVRPYLEDLGLDDISEEFWLAVRPNLEKLSDIKKWRDICFNETHVNLSEERDLLEKALKLFPEGELNENSWEEWTKRLKDNTDKKGAALFKPLRLALTGSESGPELKKLLPLIGRGKAIKRLEAACGRQS
jgi:glutamyl-tRNA synthetase